MKKIDSQQFFVKYLLRWNKMNNPRMMPWKGEKDPYKIWLSEIILQQTRVNQGLEYYNSFIRNFPSIHDLANASDERIFKLWEGLGYYTRCKNLILTARYISKNLKGHFPEKYEDILKLKGIGTYTASAIASFAYNQPYPVVDGNVIRVLSRFLGIDSATDSSEGKKLFASLAEKMLDKKHPAIYNQAIMDFGATVCKPQLALCKTCPIKSNCFAFQNDLVNVLPKKKKKIIKKTRWFYYFMIENNHKIFIHKRNQKDIWENLYEFILVEDCKNLEEMNNPDIFNNMLKNILDTTKITITNISPVCKQVLTHQTILGKFIQIKTDKIKAIKGFKAVSPDKFIQYPFPKFITKFLKDKMYL